MNFFKTHIESVKLTPTSEGKFGDEMVFSRPLVVSLIRSGQKFATMTSVNGKWQFGADVHVIIIGSIPFLRTDTNQTAKDNLGNLPEF